MERASSCAEEREAEVLASIESRSEPMLNLLWAVAVVFFVMWLLGFAAFHVTTGLIHVLLVLAIAVVLIRMLAGRRAI
jgi:hypothetical protein